jgi:hypothetical protein
MCQCLLNFCRRSPLKRWSLRADDSIEYISGAHQILLILYVEGKCDENQPMSDGQPATAAAVALFEAGRRTDGEYALVALSLFSQCAAWVPRWSAPIVALSDLL